MIRHPVLLLAALAGLTAALQALSRHPRAGRWFRWLPVPFWCYFLPMLASAGGILPSANPLYPALSTQLLPVCLILLLMRTDLFAIARIGPKALGAMLAGSAATLAGGLASFALFRRWLPENAWGAVGALAGSWTGGSANMLAVKEALNVPDTLMGPLILVDASIAYSWMGLLVASSAWQGTWDRIIGIAVKPPSGQPLLLEPPPREARQQRLARCLSALFIALSLSLGAQTVSRYLPSLGAAMNASTWTILMVTTGALLLSLTPARDLGGETSSHLGTFALLVLLTSIGARGNLRAAAAAPAFLGMGVVWIAVHGALLLAVGYLFKVPLGLLATASQANIGGPVSAPIVGATFSRPLAGLGLMMAVLGGVLGTYLGLFTALIARNFSAGF